MLALERNSFPRSNRLCDPVAFKFVFDKPDRYSDKYFTIFSRPNGLEDRPRLGLAISKKKIKKAVGRNRIKRLVREKFRVDKCSIASLDIVVLARSDTTSVSSQLLNKSLDRYFESLAYN